MSPFWIVEAAVRSLVMGATIAATLKVLNIRQVRAQRTAWVLALLAAMAMPAMAHWPISPATFSTLSAKLLPRPHVQKGVSGKRAQGAIAFGPTRPAGVPAPTLILSVPKNLSVTANAPVSDDTRPIDHASATASRPWTRSFTDFGRLAWKFAHSMLTHAAAIYICITGFLLVRLILGLLLALRLRREARPSSLHAEGFPEILLSPRVQTPVTIGSSIVLPLSSRSWDKGKLGIVLAHERAHVQQADFHVHLLAGLHCALFWFSPFSWWLERKLAALGEALSDLAALQQAESRSSYAEVLLTFATPTRQPIAAVAMARASNLRPRIERLLNDRLFCEAISGTRRHPVLAASIVPLALLGSASLVRLHAAESVPPKELSAAPRHAAEPASSATAAKPAAIIQVPAAAREQAQAPIELPPFPAAAKAAPASFQEVAPPVVASAPDPGEISAPVSQNDQNLASAYRDLANLTSKKYVAQAMAFAKAYSHGYADVYAFGDSYSWSDWEGDTFALVTSDGKITFNGHYDQQFEDIRRKTQGDFLYYEHDGKRYVIQDAAILARAKELYAPIQELGKKQEELGRKQEALGKQQAALGQQMEAVKVPTPDLTKELARLDEATQELKKLQTMPQLDAEQLANLQEKIGEIQGKLGELQGEAGEQQGKLGAQEGELGAEQGVLGAEQGRLGALQGKLSAEAWKQLKPMIERAIHDGLAKPAE